MNQDHHRQSDEPLRQKGSEFVFGLCPDHEREVGRHHRECARAQIEEPVPMWDLQGEAREGQAEAGFVARLINRGQNHGKEKGQQDTQTEREN